MNVKQHYEEHLSHFYDWMVGDFEELQNSSYTYFERHNIKSSGGLAIDLGAGHGIHAISLAKQGFKVQALDFDERLLGQLRERAKGLAIEIHQHDITDFMQVTTPAELILCMGDTLAHLDSFETLQKLFENILLQLISGGKCILSFRDYSQELEGTNRFIPVKADDFRILTCILDYGVEKVRVTDQLYEKEDGQWVQKVSSYEKLRLIPDEIVNQLVNLGFKLIAKETLSRMVYVIVEKQH